MAVPSGIMAGSYVWLGDAMDGKIDALKDFGVKENGGVLDKRDSEKLKSHCRIAQKESAAFRITPTLLPNSLPLHSKLRPCSLRARQLST